MEHNCTLPNPTGPAGLPPVARRARFVVAGVRQRQLCVNRLPRNHAGPCGPASHARAVRWRGGRAAPTVPPVCAPAARAPAAPAAHDGRAVPACAQPARRAGLARWRGPDTGSGAQTQPAGKPEPVRFDKTGQVPPAGTRKT